MDVKNIYNKISNDTETILTPTWQRNNVTNKQLILSCDSFESVVFKFSSKWDFSVDGVISWKKCEHDIIPALNWLKKEYPDVVYSPISKYINPSVVKNNLSVNHCQVNIMRHTLNSHHNLDTCESILEIGSGYGAFARELLLKNKKIKYVIIDLCESIICSYSYLNLEFPDKSHVMVTEKSDFDRDFDILYVPITFLKDFIDSKKITNFDLCINTCSFGEMCNETVNNYYNLITNVLNVKSVYWLNRFLDNGTQTENSNACMTNIPKQWHVKYWKRIPKYLECPYIMIYHAKYVEMYVDIKKHNDVYINTTDELYNLWNVNRLIPTINSVESMIKYIENILPTAVELIFYKNLLKELKQKN